VTESDASFTWVASDRLLAEEVGPWMELPLWLPMARYAGMLRAPAARARAAGLTCRPLAETIKATLTDAEPVDGVGLTSERERELLSTSG
jgi:2'-hydroxyisoflavone reductase